MSYKQIWLDYFDRYVITPYNEYPPLLGLLLKLLNGELVWSTRREVLKVVMLQLDFSYHYDILSFVDIMLGSLGSWHYGCLGSSCA